MNRNSWVPVLAALLCAGAAPQPALAEPPARAVQIAQDAEVAFWESIKDSKNPAEFKAYLDTFPNGKFAALARVRMQALQGAAAPAAAPAAPAAAPAPAPGKALAGKTYTTSRQATVRQQPNADSAVVTTIAQGAPVTIVADAGNDWYQIASVNNLPSFMHGSQLQGVSVQAGGPATAASAPAAAASALPTLPGGAPPPAAPAPAPAAAATPAQPERLFQASRMHVRVYPEPTARSAYMRDEYYVEDQVIKVYDEVPTRRGQSWLKVVTPSGKTGYVFSGEVRPQGMSKTRQPIKTPEMDD